MSETFRPIREVDRQAESVEDAIKQLDNDLSDKEKIERQISLREMKVIPGRKSPSVESNDDAIQRAV